MKLDFIGDWVLCTPFIRNLRLNAPQARITAVVLDRVRELAVTCPDLDRVIAVRERRSGGLLLVCEHEKEMRSFLDDYRNGGFDLAIVPRWDADFWGAAALAAGSRARLVVGFSERCTGRKRRLNRGQDRLFTHVLDRREAAHEVEHNLALLRFIGGAVTTRRVAVHLAGSDLDRASSFVRDALRGSDRPVVAIAPFASEPKRTWPLSRLARLLPAVSARFGCNLVVIGSSADARRGAQLAGDIGGVSACGRLSLRAAAALLGRSTALIGMDSGPAHMAAALGIPTLVLCCHPEDGTADHANSPVRFAPWSRGSPLGILRPDRAVLPCRDCCEADRPHCILQITEAEFLNRAKALIEQGLQNRTTSSLDRPCRAAPERASGG